MQPLISTIRFQNFLSILNGCSVHRKQPPLPLPQDLVPSILLSVSTNLPILASACKWNHTNLGFCGFKKKSGYLSGRQMGGKERETSQMLLSLALSLPGACPSFPARLQGTVPMRLLLAAPSAVHLSSFRFLPVLQEADFPLAGSVSWAQKQGRLSPAGSNPFLCSLAGLGRAAARLLVSSECALATKELCVCDQRALAGARLTEVVSCSWYSLSLPLRPGAWGALRPDDLLQEK